MGFRVSITQLWKTNTPLKFRLIIKLKKSVPSVSELSKVMPKKIKTTKSLIRRLSLTRTRSRLKLKLKSLTGKGLNLMRSFMLSCMILRHNKDYQVLIQEPL